jgi:hypothetical protein
MLDHDEHTQKHADGSISSATNNLENGVGCFILGRFVASNVRSTHSRTEFDASQPTYLFVS